MGNDRVKWFEPMEAAKDLALQATTPIICHNGHREAQHGMGTFLQVGEKKFLVTAAHVINNAVNARYGMSVFDGIHVDSGSQGIRLTGQPIQLQGTIDVAVVELSDETSSRLLSRKFLSLAYFHMKPVRPGSFCLFGFPTSETGDFPDGKGKYMAPFAYGTVNYPGDPNLLEDFDVKEHIALYRGSDNAVDREGNPRSMPAKLEGISGCPIWQVHIQGQSTHGWTPQSIYVVGVQTGVSKSAIRATQCWAVERILWDEFPSLRNILELYGCTPSEMEKSKIKYAEVTFATPT